MMCIEAHTDSLIKLTNALLLMDQGIDEKCWELLADMVRECGDKPFIDWFFATGRIKGIDGMSYLAAAECAYGAT